MESNNNFPIIYKYPQTNPTLQQSIEEIAANQPEWFSTLVTTLVLQLGHLICIEYYGKLCTSSLNIIAIYMN